MTILLYYYKLVGKLSTSSKVTKVRQASETFLALIMAHICSCIRFDIFLQRRQFCCEHFSPTSRTDADGVGLMLKVFIPKILDGTKKLQLLCIFYFNLSPGMKN